MKKKFIFLLLTFIFTLLMTVGVFGATKKYTVTFNKNTNVIYNNTVKQTIKKNDTAALTPKVGELQKRSKYKFLGWYTKRSGGTKWNWNNKITKNTTLYAHWSKVNPNTVFAPSLMLPTNKVDRTGERYDYSLYVHINNKNIGRSTYWQVQRIKDNTYKTTYVVYPTTTKQLYLGNYCSSQGDYSYRIRAVEKDSTGAYIYGKWSKTHTVIPWNMKTNVYYQPTY